MAERLIFERSLYSPEAVESAAALFSEHAKIEVKSENDGIVTEIEAAAGYEPALIVNSFANHVLHDTITRRRQAAPEEDA